MVRFSIQICSLPILLISFYILFLCSRTNFSSGHLRLVNALSKLYSPLIKRELDPLTQIQIANGASGMP